MKTKILTLCAFIALAGCGDDNLPEPSFTENLRIVAVKSDPVAVRAGGSTTVTALVADPKGSGRNITYTWEVCLTALLDDTGTKCTQTLTTSTQTTTSTTPTFTYVNPFTGASAFTVTLKASAGSENRLALRTVTVVSSTASETAAPTLSSFSVNGDSGTSAVSLTSGRGYDLVASVSGVTDGLFFLTWVTDGGNLEASRTSSKQNIYSPSNASGTYNIYVVLNDGTGGVDFKTRQVTVP